MVLEKTAYLYTVFIFNFLPKLFLFFIIYIIICIKLNFPKIRVSNAPLSKKYFSSYPLNHVDWLFGIVKIVFGDV